MKTTFFKLLSLTLFITFASCNKEATIDYKYADKPAILACNFTNSQLYNEAIYSFENDVLNTYDKQYKSAPKAYSSFITNAINGNLKVEDVASEHSLKIAKALIADSEIWNKNGTNVTINYSDPLMDCIANNIKDTNLKQTFNALLSTNSMRRNLILAPIRSSSRTIPTDGSIKAFLAFEYFYSNLMSVEKSQLKVPEPEPAKANAKVNFNQTPKAANPASAKPVAKKDAHAGHNH